MCLSPLRTQVRANFFTLLLSTRHFFCSSNTSQETTEDTESHPHTHPINDDVRSDISTARVNPFWVS